MSDHKVAPRLCLVRRLVVAPGDPARARAFARNGLTWVVGSVITWAFWDPVGVNDLTTEGQRKIVRQAFQKWINSKINLTIKEVKDRRKANIRIAFGYENGSWSYVGNQNRGIPKSEFTMHFGWDLSSQRGTAEHEIGHALGFDHEHQHPKCLLQWDTEAVVKDYMSSQGWTKEEVYQQVINRVEGPYTGLPWNPESIMHYPFSASLILAPPEQHANGVPYNSEIHEDDFAAVLLMYPPDSSKESSSIVDGTGRPAKKGSKKRKTEEHVAEKLNLWEPKEITTAAGVEVNWVVPVEEGGSFIVRVLGDAEVLTVVHAHAAEEDAPQQLAAGILSAEKGLPLTLVASSTIDYHVTMRIVHNSSKVFALLTQK